MLGLLGHLAPDNEEAERMHTEATKQLEAARNSIGAVNLGTAAKPAVSLHQVSADLLLFTACFLLFWYLRLWECGLLPSAGQSKQHSRKNCA